MVARTGQSVFQRPEAGPAQAPVAACRVPLGNRNSDVSSRLVHANQAGDTGQVVVGALEIGDVVMVRTDIIEPLPGRAQDACRRVAR